MSLSDWFGLFAALGIWAGGIVAYLTLLHARRSRAQAERDGVINRRMDALLSRIDEGLEQARTDHRALGIQVTDIARQVADHYMPRREAEALLRQFTEALVLARTELGAGIDGVRARVDQLYERVEFRRERG